MDAGCESRKKMYTRAKKVADRFGTQSFFDEHEEHGHRYVDGYVYPCTDNIEDVLNALDKAKVDFDNIDLPKSARKLAKKLKKRYPRGVSVNLGEIEEKCE